MLYSLAICTISLAISCSSANTNQTKTITTQKRTQNKPLSDRYISGKTDNESVAKRKAKEFATTGAVNLMKQRYADAILDYQRAFRLDSSAQLATIIATIYNKIERYDEALEFAELAYAIDSLSYDVYPILIDLYRTYTRTEEALVLAKRLVAAQATLENMLVYGQVLETTDRTEALQVYERLLNDYGEVNEMVFRMATIQASMRDTTGYIRSMERLYQNNPDISDVAVDLMNVYLETNAISKADSLLQRIVRTGAFTSAAAVVKDIGTRLLSKSDSNTRLLNTILLGIGDSKFRFDPDMQELGGYVVEKLGDSTRSLQFFNRATFASDTAMSVGLRIGLHYLQTGRPEISEQQFGIVEQKHPLDYRPSMYRGFAWSSMKSSVDNHKKAILFLKRSIRLEKNLPQVWFQLGYLYDKTAKLDSSDYCYEQSLALDSSNALTCNNYAYSLSLRNQKSEYALKLSKRAIEAEPNNPSYLDTYGWILFKMGKYSESLPYFEDAVKKGANSATIFEHLGDNYSKLGNTENAISAWKRSLELDPTRSSAKQRLLQKK